VLGLVGLEGFDDRLPNQLSGGQQQRVALARSLVVEPAILLLDEPLSNLDAKLRERMRVELKQIQRRTGITFVYVTHDQAEAMALSDHIAVMHRGQLQQFGTPREVYSRPANRIVADFMGQVNFLPARVVDDYGKRARIEIGGGAVLTLDVSRQVTKGEEVDLAVRPEDIKLCAAGNSPAMGKITEVTFLGNVTEYIVTGLGENRVRIQTHAAQVFGVGEPVALGFDPDRAMVFNRTG
jgi:iron(III) transport system ATP-binding protein